VLRFFHKHFSKPRS